MTREMQDTDRALVQAERAWLIARGWALVAGSTSYAHPFRYTHPAAPQARESYTARDALAMTRSEPLRFMARRYTTPGPA